MVGENLSVARHHGRTFPGPGREPASSGVHQPRHCASNASRVKPQAGPFESSLQPSRIAAEELAGIGEHTAADFFSRQRIDDSPCGREDRVPAARKGGGVGTLGSEVERPYLGSGVTAATRGLIEDSLWAEARVLSACRPGEIAEWLESSVALDHVDPVAGSQ